jgi:hypothetical protein
MNLKAAKALGLTIPEWFLRRADYESQLSKHGVLGQDGSTWFAKLDDKAWRARSGHEGVSETGSSGTP